MGEDGALGGDLGNGGFLAVVDGSALEETDLGGAVSDAGLGVLDDWALGDFGFGGVLGIVAIVASDGGDLSDAGLVVVNDCVSGEVDGWILGDGSGLEGASSNGCGLVFVECWGSGEDGALKGTSVKGRFLVVRADPVS